ncbi:Bacterial alpha-L-rhamnosidase [Candidatus Bathyarchaeota archaeon]|nr:Bacterial alpha-L-rhamnosidase [Candidatus Bathyarchaeota archaeon]
MVDVKSKVRLTWHGKWIWAKDALKPRKEQIHRRSGHERKVQAGEKNVFCYFRHVFSMRSAVEQAIIHITADSRYKLFVNGRYVGRGINRCESYYWYYNAHDLTDYLQEGKNVIAIHGRFYGQDFAYYTRPGGRGRHTHNSGKGGVLFDVKMKNYDGTVTWIGSGNDTRVMINSGERSDMPLKNDALGFLEEFDSRKVPRDWNEIECDDSTWNEPIILDYPVKTLLRDENQRLHEEQCLPSEILKIGENDDVNHDMDEEEKEEHIDFCVQHMLEGPIGVLEHFTVNNANGFLAGKGPLEIVPMDGASGKVLSILLKFPHEMVGYPRIEVESPENVIIDVLPSEKMSNDLPLIDWMSNKRGSRVILRGGHQFFEQWDWEGYLYMLVKIRELHGTIRFHQLSTNRTCMKISRRGTFSCNEPELVELWEACARTLLCCAVDAYLDCPSREQRAYIGDAYPEALIANACFGEPRLTRKLIYDTAYGQRQDGITYSFHPGDAVPQTHIIPDYCLYWMQLTRDYYMYYGDEKVLEDMYPHFLLAIEWFWKYRDERSGLLSNLPYWTFIDWSFPHDKPGTWAILNAQFMDALSFVASIAEKLGDIRVGERLRKVAASMKKAIDGLFWDEGEGCYRDFHLDGKLHQVSYMTNAYMVLMEVTTDQTKIEKIIARVFEYPGAEKDVKQQIDDYYLKRMSHHSFGDNLKDFVMVAQPFFQHHVNKFFDKVGRHDLLLKFIRKWLPMLRLGKTGTIWETWSIHGSECHAWAATPAFDLSTYWLGVRPAAPGFERIEISPTFHHLESVDGMFPTCRGDVKVSWKKMNKEVIINISLPSSIPDGMFIVPALDGVHPTGIKTRAVKIEPRVFKLHPGENEFEIYY